MKVIDKWSQVSIKQFEAMTKVKSDNDLDLYNKTMEILYGEVLKDMKYIQGIDKLLSTEPRDNKPVKSEYIISDGTLRCDWNLTKWNANQYVSYNTVVQNGGSIVDMISIFLVPKGKEYSIDYDVEKVKEIISNELTIEDALGMSAFFLKISIKFAKITASYLSKTEKKLRKAKKKLLKRSR